MPSKPFFRLCLLLCFLICSLSACDLLPSVTINGTPVTSSSNGTPDSQGTPSLNVWYKAASGMETRHEDWKSPGNNEDTVTIVRLDPHHVHLSVAYQPTEPLLISEWAQKEHNAALIINGGYFDQQDNATGLVVADGQIFGTSYDGFGGMLSVDAKGHISLRSLHQHPYDHEQLQQATQSEPMLVLPGGQRAQFDADAASSRRSVVAMDKQGRLLFITSPSEAFSIDELADLLFSSDLSIDVALNLDGGASTGLFVRTGSQPMMIDSFARLPIVVIVKV